MTTYPEYIAHFRYRNTSGELHDTFKRYSAPSLKEAKAVARRLEGHEETKWLMEVWRS